MPDVHEACGLDVDAMYSLLQILRDAGLAAIDGDYPFERIRPTGTVGTILQQCDAAKIAIDDIVIDLRFDLLG